MNELEKWCADFQEIVPVDERELTKEEATFRCLQGVSYVIDKLVNVGFKDLLCVGHDASAVREEPSLWCDLDEICRRHPELRRSNVVSRQWRLENDFPCKGGYKCRQMYYEPDVIEWIDRNLREKKC